MLMFCLLKTEVFMFENQFTFFYLLILCYSPFDHKQVQYIICMLFVMALFQTWLQINGI